MHRDWSLRNNTLFCGEDFGFEFQDGYQILENKMCTFVGAEIVACECMFAEMLTSCVTVGQVKFKWFVAGKQISEFYQEDHSKLKGTKSTGRLFPTPGKCGYTGTFQRGSSAFSEKELLLLPLSAPDPDIFIASPGPRCLETDTSNSLPGSVRVKTMGHVVL